MTEHTGHEDLQAALKRWSEGVEKKLSKRPERKAEFVNTSGIPVERLYTPLDGIGSCWTRARQDCPWPSTFLPR